VSRERRPKRDLHALDENGMVLCNPRDKEAAHRAQMEGIATEDRVAVTCRKCLALLYAREKARIEEKIPSICAVAGPASHGPPARAFTEGRGKVRVFAPCRSAQAIH